MTSDRIAYQTYNDVQSINARRHDMWAVLAEAARAREAGRNAANIADEPEVEAPSRGQSDADPLSDRVALRVASLDRYEVSGRGIIHVIQIPESHRFYGTPRSLVGRWVVVDGELSVVRAVETYAVAEGHPALKRPCGLLLSRGVIGDAPPRAS